MERSNRATIQHETRATSTNNLLLVEHFLAVISEALRDLETPSGTKTPPSTKPQETILILASGSKP